MSLATTWRHDVRHDVRDLVASSSTTSWRRYFRDDGIARRVARPPRAARDDENDEEEEEEDIAREVVGIDAIARVNMSVARALE